MKFSPCLAPNQNQVCFIINYIFQRHLWLFLQKYTTRFLHEERSLALLFFIFNLLVPEYEIVSIFHKEGGHHARKVRSYSTQIRLRAFDQNITLYLEPTDHVLLSENTPVYAAHKDDSQSLGIRYTLLENVRS